MIYNEDCRETFKKISYDYVFTSPPDFEEIKLNPKENNYKDFLDSWTPLLKPTNNLVTICITDRKVNGGINTKHIDVIASMKENGWYLKENKIWGKSLKINLFRLNFMNILTFAKKPFKLIDNKNIPDVLFDDKPYRYKDYNDTMSLEVCKQIINKYTNKDNIVYDCFFGAGTTGLACKELGVDFLGSEIDKNILNYYYERLKLK